MPTRRADAARRAHGLYLSLQALSSKGEATRRFPSRWLALLL